MTFSAVDYEAGQRLFNRLVRFDSEKFLAQKAVAYDEFEKAKATNGKIKDLKFGEQLLNNFATGVYKSPADQQRMRVYLFETAKTKLSALEGSIPAAFLVLLAEADRGEITQTEAEKAELAALTTIGKNLVDALKADPSKKAELKAVVENSLKLLTPQLDRKLFDEEHKWDVKTHTLVPCAFDRRRVYDLGIAVRDFRTLAITSFVEKAFQASDRPAVLAYLFQEIFYSVNAVCAECPEVYVYYTSGWAGQMHTKVTENIRTLLNSFAA